MILLDTHVLIWTDFGLAELGRRALSAINEASAAGSLAVSAISFWEASMLSVKRRVALPEAPMQWRRTLLEAGLVELPVTGDIGIQATQLQAFHPDPADRLICATALHRGATLLTADEAILAWEGPLMRMDARE